MKTPSDEHARSPLIDAGATFDRRRAFRYRLWRTWAADAPLLACILLNPSTADARRDDPTVRRCQAIARRHGYGGITVVNLFAYRARDPNALLAARDPVGPRNDEHLYDVISTARHVLLAWGNRGVFNHRDRQVQAMLNDAHEAFCLGRTRLGQPRHPLYLPVATRFIEWTPRREAE